MAKLSDKFKDELKIELSLSENVKDMQKKSDALEKKITNAQVKLSEYTTTAKDVKGIKAEYSESQKLLKGELSLKLDETLGNEKLKFLLQILISLRDHDID